MSRFKSVDKPLSPTPADRQRLLRATVTAEETAREPQTRTRARRRNPGNPA
jgi:hypothetical protein